MTNMKASGVIKTIPNVVTCANVGVGIYGIHHLSVYQNLNVAIVFVAIAGFFDMLDGLLARALNARSELGKQLDSLADAVSFGVLPSIFVIHWVADAQLSWIGVFIGVFSVLRLAMFNLDTSQSIDFRGLPTPANAILIVSLAYLNWEVPLWGQVALVAFSCFLLVAPVRMYSLKIIKNDPDKWVRIATVLLVGAGIFVMWMAFLPFIIPLYILLSVFWSVIVKRGNIFLTKDVS